MYLFHSLLDNDTLDTVCVPLKSRREMTVKISVGSYTEYMVS